MTPGELARRLGELPVEQATRDALEAAAGRLEAAVREALSQPPGGGHDAPWLRSGALRDGVSHLTDDDGAVVGSSDPAAAPQEQGTSRLPPRPFLAPTAARLGEELARGIGAAVAGVLR